MVSQRSKRLITILFLTSIFVFSYIVLTDWTWYGYYYKSGSHAQTSTAKQGEGLLMSEGIEVTIYRSGASILKLVTGMGKVFIDLIFYAIIVMTDIIWWLKGGEKKIGKPKI